MVDETTALPVESPLRITVRPYFGEGGDLDFAQRLANLPVEQPPELVAIQPTYGVPYSGTLPVKVNKAIEQTWPVRMVKSGVSLPKDVYEGKVDPTSEEGIERAQDLSGLVSGGAFGNVALHGVEKNALGIVPVAKAKQLKVSASQPSDVLKSAVENTPGAVIDPDGALRINVKRGQHPDQEMSESIRGGVFYLPQGDKNFRHYKGTNNYGGRQVVEGETAYLNPLVVKGATGGKAPENAYIQLKGKDAFKELDKDIMQIVTAKNWMKNKDPGAFDDLTQRYFQKYAPELTNHIDYILENSTKGNQLRYALQEAAIGSAVRNAGHDGVIGYSVGRGQNSGKPFISEIFDVRENRYPSPSGDYSVHPQFLADDSVGSGIAAVANSQRAPAFYSAVEQAVKNAKQNSATAEQWVGFLKNQAGIKPEELQWTLKDLPSGSITKKQLEDHISENKVQLKEVVKGGHTKWTQKDSERLDELENLRHNITDEQEIERQALITRESAATHEEGLNGGQPTVTKYHSYQLPGGENYKETLLTLPHKEFNAINHIQEFKSDIMANVHTLEDVSKARRFNPNFAETVKGKTDQEVLAMVEQARKQPEYQPPYKSSHWDEPNVLAHIRHNDRDIPGVGKTLHLEEIQSDWHQEGRKQGYRNSNQNEQQKAYNRYVAEGMTPIDAMEKARSEFKSGPIPDAPFKKTWDELALKNMIRKAAEGGYDAISWTPGEAQAARYDLSKHIQDLNYHKNSDGSYGINGLLSNGKRHNFGDNISKDKLADFVGKEVAEKILENKGEGKLSNIDLKVGGEGMKAFYDKMLVDKANAIAKKFGGKVEQKDLFDVSTHKIVEGQKASKGVWYIENEKSQSIGPDYRSKEAAEQAFKEKSKPIHVLRITPQMREHALTKGFPLFSAGLLIVTPVPHDPFKHKLTPIDYNPFTNPMAISAKPGDNLTKREKTLENRAATNIRTIVPENLDKMVIPPDEVMQYNVHKTGEENI